MRGRATSTWVVGAVVVALSATIGVACGSFSSDELPIAIDAGDDADASGPLDASNASDASDTADASVGVDAHFSIGCRNVVCTDLNNPVCCAVFGGAPSFCRADDSCGGSITLRCDDSQDCLALNRGTSTCCAVLNKPRDAGANAVTQSYCSATPCQGQSGGLAIETCALSGPSSQCHAGTNCMPANILDLAFCE